MVDTDQDRFPVLTEVLSRIIEESDLASQPVQRIEINLFASGQANYRVWAPRAEEAEVGFLSEATS
jgi:hypothetical protein